MTNGSGSRQGWLKRFFLESLNWEREAFPPLIDFTGKALLFGLGAIITLWLTPVVSYHFEQEKRKTVYYTDAIQTLSTDTKELLGRLTTYSYDDGLSVEDKKKLRTELRETVTKLHWRAIEYALVFKDQKFRDLVTGYQVSLEKISEALKSDKNPPEGWEGLTKDFAKATASIVATLARRADGEKF